MTCRNYGGVILCGDDEPPRRPRTRRPEATVPTVPDNDLVQRVAEVLHRRNCSCGTHARDDLDSALHWDTWLSDARAVIAAIQGGRDA